jgi:HlyD family secretion protein
VRVEPYVVGKRWLTGDNTERVDTRALQVIYALDEIDSAVFVGQRVDVFIDAGKQTDEVDSLEPNSWRTLAR